MGRRGLLGLAAGAAALMLSGCGRGAARFERELVESVSAVSGVEAAELEVRDGAEFQRNLVGQVQIVPDDGSRVLAVFDEVIGVIVRAAAKNDGFDHLDLQWFTGHSDGTELTVWDLDPAFARDEPLLARSLFDRYGVS